MKWKCCWAVLAAVWLGWLLVSGFGSFSRPDVAAEVCRRITFLKRECNVVAVLAWCALTALFVFRWRRCVRGTPSWMSGCGRVTRMLAVVGLCILAAVIVGGSLFVTQWARDPRWSCPDRPMYCYGWPLPWKIESAGGMKVLWYVPPIGWLLTCGYLLFVCGFTGWRSILKTFALVLGIVLALGAFVFFAVNLTLYGSLF